MVLDACERMHAHLTAALVSNDPLFLQARLAHLDIIFHFSFPLLQIVRITENLDACTLFFLPSYHDIIC